MHVLCKSMHTVLRNRHGDASVMLRYSEKCKVSYLHGNAVKLTFLMKNDVKVEIL
jgi:hypothetical protein